MRLLVVAISFRDPPPDVPLDVDPDPHRVAPSLPNLGQLLLPPVNTIHHNLTHHIKLAAAYRWPWSAQALSPKSAP